MSEREDKGGKVTGSVERGPFVHDSVETGMGKVQGRAVDDGRGTVVQALLRPAGLVMRSTADADFCTTLPGQSCKMHIKASCCDHLCRFLFLSQTLDSRPSATVHAILRQSKHLQARYSVLVLPHQCHSAKPELRPTHLRTMGCEGGAQNGGPVVLGLLSSLGFRRQRETHERHALGAAAGEQARVADQVAHAAGVAVHPARVVGLTIGETAGQSGQGLIRCWVTVGQPADWKLFHGGA